MERGSWADATHLHLRDQRGKTRREMKAEWTPAIRGREAGNVKRFTHGASFADGYLR